MTMDSHTSPRSIPGEHKSDGGIPPWCPACTAHYRCPIRFPCSTFRKSVATKD
jgi:hypothetical protein